MTGQGHGTDVIGQERTDIDFGLSERGQDRRAALIVAISLAAMVAVIGWIAGLFNVESFCTAVVIIPVFLYSLRDTYKYRITLTASYIERQGARTTRIRYSDVRSARIDDDQMIVWARKRRIIVFEHTEHRERVILQFLEHMMAYPEIRVYDHRSLS